MLSTGENQWQNSEFVAFSGSVMWPRSSKTNEVTPPPGANTSQFDSGSNPVQSSASVTVISATPSHFTLRPKLSASPTSAATGPALAVRRVGTSAEASGPASRGAAEASAGARISAARVMDRVLRTDISLPLWLGSRARPCNGQPGHAKLGPNLTSADAKKDR